MKKIAIILSLLLILSFTSVSATTLFYDVYYTDITACINHYNIPCFAVNGTSAVVIEDLPKYGFKVQPLSGTNPPQYQISVTPGATVNPVTFEIDINQVGTKAGAALLNASYVYANGNFINTYTMNGYTLIPLESLSVFGEVHWVPEQWALKLWVDGIRVRPTFTPVQVNSSSKVYKETLEVVNNYIATGDYDNALSALNWALGLPGNLSVAEGAHIDIESHYFRLLYTLREEIAYIVIMKNVDIYVNAGNYYEAASYILDQYSTYYSFTLYSHYYDVLFDKFEDCLYNSAIINSNIHLSNKDYHSAYTSLANSIDIYKMYPDGFGINGCYQLNPYTYDLLLKQMAEVCSLWHSSNDCPIVIAAYDIYETENDEYSLELKVVNLTEKPIQAFRFSCEPQNIFGDAANAYHTTFKGYASDDIYIDKYYYDYIYWDFSDYSTTKRLNNLRITDVVFEDGTIWTIK